MKQTPKIANRGAQTTAAPCSSVIASSWPRTSPRVHSAAAAGRSSIGHPWPISNHPATPRRCHDAHVQSGASRKRRRLAEGLVVAGLVMLLAPVLANVVAPGVMWMAWLARSLPAALVIAGVLVWYRADTVFDRGFEPDESPDDESHDTDR
jgi:hypothetical protein